ncbi:serine/arginine-rich splicing factor SR45a [Oryza brachyantha]|uniref:serine/arginine-rich splicing factor SR45a n=1 Tax=Oryza brachyantha TaxID=4533 RepID=UPI0003EAB9F7|nr:serine/arginine-rich splicing factor SR45a [Oryza brachyantha]
MSYSRWSRYESRSYSPASYRRSSRSRYRSLSRSVDSSDVENPGNNLYVTGLSARVTDRDLEKHFSTEGEVIDASIVLDPWTRESRGFGFVTMATVEEAGRCIKYLDHSVLEGRVITVEKAKRRRGRTPTPGRYLGTKSSRARRYSPSFSPVQRDRYSSRFSPEREQSYSPYGGRRSYSPYNRRRSYSPYERRRRRSYSPYDRRRSYSPYGRSPSPYGGRRSYSPYDRRGSWRRSYSPYRSPYRYRRERSYAYDNSVSPYYSRRYSPSPRGRSYSRSVSPQRSYSRSSSPVSQRSGSYSTRKRYNGRKLSRSRSSGKRGSRESYSHSRSSYSRSVSRESSE